MVLAEFGVQLRDQLAERLPVPCHQFGQEQGCQGRVAFGQMEFRANAARLLAAEQDVALEHNLADVFESDGRLQHFAAKLPGDLVHHLGDGKCLGHVAGKPARAGQVPE